MWLLLSTALAADPAALDAKARAAFDAGDLRASNRYAERALRRDEEDVTALFISARALYTLAASLPAGDPEQQAALLTAQRRFEQVVRLDPGSLFGAIAADTLNRTYHLPDPQPSCSAAAQTEEAAAEQAFVTMRYEEAAVHYAAANAACPGNPIWLTWAGDVPFGQGDYAGALALYQQALAVEPCYAPAWRYSADAYARRQEWPDSISASVTAAACDPTYLAAQSQLGPISAALGGQFDPALAQRSFVPSPDASEAERAVWDAYLAGLDVPGTPFERRRSAVRGALLRWAELGAPEAGPWGTLAAADAAGFGEAALFWLTLDAELAPEFLAWRGEHRAVMSAFVLQFVMGVQEEGR